MKSYDIDEELRKSVEKFYAYKWASQRSAGKKLTNAAHWIIDKY